MNKHRDFVILFLIEVNNIIGHEMNTKKLNYGIIIKVHQPIGTKEDKKTKKII